MKKPKATTTPQMVTSVSSILDNTTYQNGVSVSSEEDTRGRKLKFLSILDKATDQFLQNLDEGKVELKSTMDLERIVKLTLLLSGEAESITGSVDESKSVSLSMSKIDSILDENDPAIQAMFRQIYEGYNTINDNICESKEV